MSKIPFFNSFGRKPATNQNDNLVDTIVSELLEAPSQSSVDIPSEKTYGPGMSEWKPFPVDSSSVLNQLKYLRCWMVNVAGRLMVQ